MVPLKDIVDEIVMTTMDDDDDNDVVVIVITWEPEPDIDLSKLPPKPTRPTPQYDDMEPEIDPTDTNQTYPVRDAARHQEQPAGAVHLSTISPPPTRHPQYDGAQDPPDNNPYPTAGRRD